MKWEGASQRKGTLSRLETSGKDVKAVTLYTHSFSLLEAEGARVPEDKRLSYTATADSPEEAQALAFAVYQQARKCRHDMQVKGPMLTECTHCGIQRRVALTPPPPTAVKPQPERRFFGFSLFGL